MSALLPGAVHRIPYQRPRVVDVLDEQLVVVVELALGDGTRGAEVVRGDILDIRAVSNELD